MDESMITIRTFADVTADHQVIVKVPPEVPVGRAELVVTIAPQEEAAAKRGILRERFGTVHGGDANSSDNERIDSDLARAYGHSRE